MDIRVLVFGMTYNPGGLESVVMNYYRHIDRQKVQFDFLCYNQEPAYAEEIRRLGGKIKVIPGRKSGVIRNHFAMKKWFRENAYHYAALWENANSLTDIQPLIFAKKYGIPKRIMHSHNSNSMNEPLTSFLHKHHKKQILNLATDFWACSLVAAKWMFCEEIVKSKHFHLITNAIESEKFAFNKTIRDEERTKLGISDCFVVGHVGRFYFQKNQEFLVRIFQEIHKRNLKSVLILVGQGEDEQKIHEQVEKLGLKDAVKFLGVCTNMERLYQAMDIFVLPSHFEGLPLVLLEAQANGLPCYVSDCISKEAQVTSSCQYLSLNLSAEKWADKIMSHENNRNPDAVKEIQNSSYDIQKNAKDLEAFFINGD